MKATGRPRTRTAGSPTGILNCLESIDTREDPMEQTAIADKLKVNLAEKFRSAMKTTINQQPMTPESNKRKVSMVSRTMLYSPMKSTTQRSELESIKT